MSLGTAGAYRVGGAAQCSSMKRRYPWQPFEQPPQGTIILNNSVEYLLTNTNLALTSSRRGGMGKTKAQNGTQTASHCKTLCKELQASNCVYKSRGTHPIGIGPPSVLLEKLLISICSRLTLPKLHLATLKKSTNEAFQGAYFLGL